MVLKAITTPTEVDALTELLTSARMKATLSALTVTLPVMGSAASSSSPSPSSVASSPVVASSSAVASTRAATSSGAASSSGASSEASSAKVTRVLLRMTALAPPKMVLVATTTLTPVVLASTVLSSCAKMMADSVAVMLTSPVTSIAKPSTRASTSLRTSLRTTRPPKADAPESPPLTLPLSVAAASTAAAATSTRPSRSIASQRLESLKSSLPKSKIESAPLNT